MVEFSRLAVFGRRTVLSLVCLGLLACSTAPRGPLGPDEPRWSGRMALHLQTDPVQDFSASFELQGSAQAGELRLYTPLGSTLALLRWSPARAELIQNGHNQHADSLDRLLEKVLGASIPVEALFNWVQRQPVAVPGWEADNSRLTEGRFHLHRSNPPPAVDLRVVLDAP